MRDDRIKKLVEKFDEAPTNVRFAELAAVCEHYFGPPRNKGTSHYAYRTPWPGDPRVNIQMGKGGKAKAYQVRQVLMTVNKLEKAEDG